MKCIGDKFVIREWQRNEFYVNTQLNFKMFLVLTKIIADTVFVFRKKKAVLTSTFHFPATP